MKIYKNLDIQILKCRKILEELQIFQKLLKKMKVLRKFLQNFILCREISGRSKIDFQRDYQQILRKHKGMSTLCRATHSGIALQYRAAKVVPYHKNTWMLCWIGCGMPFYAMWPKNSIGKLSVPSKEAVWHMMSKGFQNGISQLQKIITPSSPISFDSFCNLKVCKNFFFMRTQSHRWRMPTNFCCATKLQCVAFCHTAQCGRTLKKYFRRTTEKFETIVRKFWEKFQTIFKIFHFWEN